MARDLKIRNAFRFILLANTFLSLAGFSQEPSDCWWSGCRVATQKPQHRGYTLSIDDPSYTHIGMPLPKKTPNRPQAEDKFVILECEPEKNLQEGDILLQVSPISKDPEHAYELLMKTAHAAIVAKKPDGSLYALGTPKNYWPQGSLTHASYHVIRLREFPQEITSAQILAEWKSSPVKYAKIRDWTIERKTILEKVKKGIRFFEKNVPYYDSARNTQILDKKYKDLFTNWILKDEKCEDLPSQYCSELVATIYAVAGAELPTQKSPDFYLKKLEKEVIPYFKNPWETDQAAFQRSIDAFFNSTEIWTNLGVSSEEKEAILQKRKETGDPALLPKAVQKLKENIEWVWGFPPFIRNQLIYWSGTVGDGKGVITPLDFLDSVQDVKSDFSYVGTYLKSACQDPAQGPRTRHLHH